MISGTIESRVKISEDTFILKRRRNYTFFKKYPFLLERKRNHIEYLHCIQKYSMHCKARLIIKRFKNGDDRFTQLKDHNHELKAGIFMKSMFEIFSIPKTNIFILFLFQTPSQSITFNTKVIYFSSITKRMKKLIGDVLK